LAAQSIYSRIKFAHPPSARTSCSELFSLLSVPFFTSTHPIHSSVATNHVTPSVHTYIFLSTVTPIRSLLSRYHLPSRLAISFGLLGGISRNLLSSYPPPFLWICFISQIRKRACGMGEGVASCWLGLMGHLGDGSLRGDIEQQAVIEIIYGRKPIIFTTRTPFTIILTIHHFSTPLCNLTIRLSSPSPTHSGAIAAVRCKLTSWSHGPIHPCHLCY